jgi:DNA-directed RNA polymerase specialized sigma24 family protein
MHFPTTSKTLLRTLGENARSARWAEFTARYRPMMEAFLTARFPELVSDTDDIVQETLLAMVRILPNYRYSPGENGAFHNYLIGIITHKAHARLRTRKREARRNNAIRREAEAISDVAMVADSPDRIFTELDEEKWQTARILCDSRWGENGFPG